MNHLVFSKVKQRSGRRLALSFAAALSTAVLALPVFAAEAHEGKSADEVAKELANPNNDLARLTFKNQYRWYTGDLPDADQQANYTLLFQPVFPFSLGTDANGTKSTFFLRPAIPFLFDQPYPEIDEGGLDWNEVSALGDIGFDAAYAKTRKDGVLWAVGMVGSLPTATATAVASKQVRLGPEFLIAKITKSGTFGIFPSHLFDFTDSSDRSRESKEYSTTSVQPIMVLTPGGGWQLSSKPIMAYDWKADEWTVPVTLGAARTVIMGGRPVQFELEVSYYVEQADAFGPDWMVSFNVTPVVNNFIESMIRGR